MAHRYKDLTGQRFGRCVVLRFSDVNDNGNAIWRVRCDCGVEFEALAINLKCGNTRSCGCLRRESMAHNRRNRKRAGTL